MLTRTGALTKCHKTYETRRVASASGVSTLSVCGKTARVIIRQLSKTVLSCKELNWMYYCFIITLSTGGALPPELVELPDFAEGFSIVCQMICQSMSQSIISEVGEIGLTRFGLSDFFFLFSPGVLIAFSFSMDGFTFCVYLVTVR